MMAPPLHTPGSSPHWYRVADLHPQLRRHVQVRRQRYREEVAHLLDDGLRGQLHRLNASAYAFIGRCNGQRSVQAIWNSLLDSAPDQAPTQDEVVGLLSQLHRLGLLQCERTPDVQPLLQQARGEQRRTRLQAMNPLSLPLLAIDPGPLLRRLDALAMALFRPWVLGAWCVLVLTGLMAAAVHWPALQAHADAWLLTPQGLFLGWLAFPMVKAVHELAHGLAVRRWGGEVRRAGITLMLFTPVPFVDASAASGFREAHRRFTVSAAGIGAELGLAALAVLLWTQVQPGRVRDLALIVAGIGGLSTLLVNGNPLLRFDGYHMLSDAIQVPNLQARSAHVWRQLVLRHGLRLPQAPRPAGTPGELRWLLLYAPLSWGYRAALALLVVGWVGGWSPPAAVLVAALALWSLAVGPALGLWRGAPSARHRLLAWTGALALLLGAVPWPCATVAQGVVWLPEPAQVRADSGGFITTFHARDGAWVAAGDRVAQLSDPELTLEARRIDSEIAQLDTERQHLMLSDPVGAADLQAALTRRTGDRAEVQRRLDGLDIHAGMAGRLSLPHPSDREGRFVTQGEVLGHIVGSPTATLRVALSVQAAALVHTDTRAISVRLAEHPGVTLPATRTTTVTAASQRLPSAALADRSDGPHVVAPTDPQHLRTREPVWLLDLTLPLAPSERVGGRVWVRFEHAATPLALQWARQWQQLVLRNFDPGT